jgi:hypothetical protein
MESIEVSKINFAKATNMKEYRRTYDGNYKRNFAIIDDNKKRITFNIKNAKTPFGIENYNNQQILNIIIDPKKNNEHHNLVMAVKNLEKNLNNKNISNEEILSEIKEKKYYSILKYSPTNDNYILRTHIIGMPNVYTILNEKKFAVLESDIKNKNLSIEVEIGTFWITNENYGILLYAKDIKIS